MQVGPAPVAHGGAGGTGRFAGYGTVRGHFPYVDGLDKLAGGAEPNGAIPRVDVPISYQPLAANH